MPKLTRSEHYYMLDPINELIVTVEDNVITKLAFYQHDEFKLVLEADETNELINILSNLI